MPTLNMFHHLPPFGRTGWVRPSLGALAGILITGLICRLWLGPDHPGLPFLIAPMGASAVLLFAVPASPLARPWPVVGGNILSALVAWLCVMLLDDPVVAAAVAVGAAIALMSVSRSLHPPGGAVALTVAVGGIASDPFGWSFAFVPVGLNSAILLAVAWAFNNATGHAYPHRVSVQISEGEPPRFSMAEIKELLEEYDEMLDISREDLAAVLNRIEKQKSH